MRRIDVRFLTPGDIPALLELERAKWEQHQAADDEVLAQRIAAFPELSIGAFCARTGKALASLFLRPVMPAMFTAPTTWQGAANPVIEDADELARTRSLFGISLSSVDADAVKAIFTFFYPRALKHGWREIFLGSPIPGLRAHLETNARSTVWQYAHAKRKYCRRLPLDPQLRYYYRRGFRQIVSVQQNYFPHIGSMDYGVILRGAIPLSSSRPLFKLIPFFILERMSALLLRLVL